MDRLKYEVAQELGYIQPQGNVAGGPGRSKWSQEVGRIDGAGSDNSNEQEEQLQDSLDRRKYEVAQELGLLDKIKTMGWGNMTSRECGMIGGQLGGKLGGQMVKRMIEYAEAHMADDPERR
jgi:hypothetical protein